MLSTSLFNFADNSQAPHFYRKLASSSSPTPSQNLVPLAPQPFIMAQRKNPQLDALHQSILRKMQQLPENRTCADCKAPSPRWASTNLGIFVCISCSGIHRKLGTHISQVRSITLDTWTPAQIAHFQKLGNAKAAAYFEACIPEGFRRPASSDPMAMERFIRDKYEKKRYITVENGGLGGATNERERHRATPSSNSSAPPKTTAKLGPRPLQSASRYDDTRGPILKSAPLSYAHTFRSPTSSRNPPPTVTRTHMSSTFKPFNPSQMGLSKPGNAIQRASTVREIINMGFPADVAAKAAEAAQGDLERAVDWVLANDPTAKEPPKKQVEPLMDLLDFRDSAPPPKTNGVPGAMASESLLKPEPRNQPLGTVQDDFTDFADFGAFESALPASSGIISTKKPAPQTCPSNRQEPLSGSITGLYAQGMGRPAVSAATHQQNVGNNPSHTLSSTVPRPPGLLGLPQRPIRSSAIGASQVGGIQSLAKQSEDTLTSQTGNSHMSPQRSPLSWNQNAQYQSGRVQKSPGSPYLSQGNPRTVSSAGSPSGLYHHQTWNVSNTSSTMPTQEFSKLTSAGVARPGMSVKASGPAPARSPNHKPEVTAPDAIPSFTWPTNSKSEVDGKAMNGVTKPASSFGATAVPKIAESLVPPPPPPPAEVLIAGGDGVPPPPDGPPPASNPDPNSTSPGVGADGQHEKIQVDEAGTQVDHAAGAGGENVEEEDPFAALSMLALSSATSMQKERKGKPAGSGKAVLGSGNLGTPVATDHSNIDLDNLLG